MNLQHYNFNIFIYMYCVRKYIFGLHILCIWTRSTNLYVLHPELPRVAASDWMQFFFNVLYNQVANFLTVDRSPGDLSKTGLIFIFGPLGGPKKAPGWPFLCFFVFFEKPTGYEDKLLKYFT